MKKRKIKKEVKIALIILLVLILGLFTYKLFFNKPKEELKEEKIIEVKEEPKLQIIDVDSKTRPFAVMINNINVARPLQSGLQDAVIIYEIIVEGGITRYMAIFQDQQTERIGSIRSSRHYFLDYALENDAIYVHHGQSPKAMSDFSTLNIDRIVVDNTNTGWRDTSLNVSTEHTLFTSISKLNNGLGNLRTTRNKDFLLDYSVKSVDLSSIDGAKQANSVSINYSSYITSSYTYDSENKVYKRYVNGAEHTDYVTKNQYTFKNIITYQVKNYNLTANDKKGRQDIDNIGSGTGWFISEGYAVPIKWEKTSRDAQTKYTYEDGTEIKVNDGNTFIQIQPTDRTLTIE